MKLDEERTLTPIGEEFKRVDYSYDLISGNVNEVAIQAGEHDAWYHRYTYDADNRITNVHTSRDGNSWVQDAKYFYYDYGPLGRMETGDKKVQGTDYAYTIHGWIKGVNTNLLKSSSDIGQDGEVSAGNLNRYVGQDAMGYTLSYYRGDYQSRQNTGTNFTNDVGLASAEITYHDLFNGNIAQMATALTATDNSKLDLMVNNYTYDPLNRLRQMNSYLSGGTYNYADAVNAGPGRYSTDVEYDANGNIASLSRLDDDAQPMDQLTYYYDDGTGTGVQTSNLNNPQDMTNRLLYVTDGAGPTRFKTDLRTQQQGNYGYDAIGQLIRDDREQIADIEWLVTNKVSKVKRTGQPMTIDYYDANNTLQTVSSYPDDLEFRYDAMGNRCIKITKPYDASGNLLGMDHWTWTYYIRDATGNILTTYTRTFQDLGGGNYTEAYVPDEFHIYGAKRLGLEYYYNIGTGDPTQQNWIDNGSGAVFNANGEVNYNALSPN